MDRKLHVNSILSVREAQKSTKAQFPETARISGAGADIVMAVFIFSSPFFIFYQSSHDTLHNNNNISPEDAAPDLLFPSLKEVYVLFAENRSSKKEKS